MLQNYFASISSFSSEGGSLLTHPNVLIGANTALVLSQYYYVLFAVLTQNQCVISDIWHNTAKTLCGQC